MRLLLGQTVKLLGQTVRLLGQNLKLPGQTKGVLPTKQVLTTNGVHPIHEMLPTLGTLGYPGGDRKSCNTGYWQLGLGTPRYPWTGNP